MKNPESHGRPVFVILVRENEIGVSQNLKFHSILYACFVRKIVHHTKIFRMKGGVLRVNGFQNACFVRKAVHHHTKC